MASSLFLAKQSTGFCFVLGLAFGCELDEWFCEGEMLKKEGFSVVNSLLCPVHVGFSLTLPFLLSQMTVGSWTSGPKDVSDTILHIFCGEGKSV